MKKICIMGSPGSGKSTLAKRLGQLLDIQVVHLDSLFWKPGWVSITTEELKKAQEQYISQNEWIMDGSYSSVWKPRIEKADTIIFLDFPRWICLYRVLKRYWKHRNQTRSDMGKSCSEKIDVEFMQFVWSYPKTRRNKVLEAIKAYKAIHNIAWP